jgi:hypothetical protein
MEKTTLNNSLIFSVKDPEQYVRFMNNLTMMERRGTSTNRSLMRLGKDLKTVKRFLPIYQLHYTNEQQYDEVGRFISEQNKATSTCVSTLFSTTILDNMKILHVLQLKREWEDNGRLGGLKALAMRCKSHYVMPRDTSNKWLAY